VAVKIDAEKCTGCGACVQVCSVDAITMENDRAVVDGQKCIDCGVCVPECPVNALSTES
jgi:Fe-S-cluster-containing hydrogenase component 2